MKRLAKLCAIIAIVLMALAGASMAADQQRLSGHIPEAVTLLIPIESLPGSQRIDLAIGLRLRNLDSLTNLLRQIYDPASPQYRRYLTRDQFTEQFGPTEQDYQTLASFMQSNGFAISGKYPNRLLLNVRSTATNVERTFHTHLHWYRHPTEARNFYAPDTEPSLDLTVPISHIAGLDNYVLPRPADLKPVPIRLSGGVKPSGGTAPGGTYGSSDFRRAYAPGVSLTGAGQSVGLVEFDGYYTNDITIYERTNGLSNVIVTNVLLNGFTGAPGGNNGEVAVDIELAMAMAPGLSSVIVYEVGAQGSANTILNQMAADNLACQLSSSWLWNGGSDQLADQVFLEFAAQGQTFFNASGDQGAYSGAVTFPADDPFITVVGGTTLTVGQGGSWSSEIVWNPKNGESSGGGISLTYPIPTWQQGINMASNQGSISYRNLPDVAMVADNVWAVYNNGHASGYVGTSCAAPLWAGFTALVNQQSAFYGQSPVGFLNAALSVIGQGTGAAMCFHDVTNGYNTNTSSHIHFSAVPGFDLCTGWGSPAGQPLIDALEPADYLVISPPAGFTAYGLPGGPFSPSSQTVTLTNHGPGEMIWSAESTSNWMNVSPTGGVLSGGGASEQVTISLAAPAYWLPAGIYGTSILVSNETAGIVRQLEFALEPGQSLIQNGGFESGVFLDWGLDGSVFANFVYSGSSIMPHSGNYVAILAQAGSLAYLSQMLPTSPGQVYLLSFWLENPAGGSSNQFRVNWNTNSAITNNIFNFINHGAFGWTNIQLLVKAAGSNAILQFGSRNDTGYYGLDDISVTPVPIPNPSILAGSGGLVKFSWPTSVGLVYQLQYRTNLYQGNWQNLQNTIIASNGTITAFDQITSDFQRYYRILMSP